MTEKDKVEAIMYKYGRNFSILQKNATIRELKTVFNYIGAEANERQRKIAGLDDEKEKTNK